MYCTSLVDQLALRLSDGFGSGRLKPAPGTWGSIAAWLILLLFPPSPEQSAVLFLVLLPVFYWAISRTMNRLSLHDPGWIVADEWHGMILAWMFLPANPTFFETVLLLVLFRLFDAWKPWMIRDADQNLHGASAVLVDDWIAAVFAGICTILIASQL